jgi:transcription antitermination factor NusG
VLSGQEIRADGLKKGEHVAHRAKLYPLTGIEESKLLKLKSIEPQPPNASWCAIYTRHQHERTVSETLEAKGFEVFLPMYESTRRWKDRQKVLSLPLFPCYVFVRGAVERRLPILTTPGVHMIISHGERVATVPEMEIEAIRRTVEGHFKLEPHPFLRCGERVLVTRGSLRGIEGVLTRKKNLFRLVISVEMLAQSVAVEIDALDVVPAVQKNVMTLGSSLPHSPQVPQRNRLAGD